MKLSIHYQSGCYHVSDNANTTGCGEALLRISPVIDLNFVQFQHAVTCNRCKEYFTPKFEEGRKSIVAQTIGEALAKYRGRFIDNSDTELEEKTAPAMEDFTSAQEINAMLDGKILKTYLGGEETVIIPEYVEVIHDSAFARSQNLTSVEIPDSVKEIRDFAFAVCPNLKEITLPQSVKLGKNVFYDCSALETVKIRFPGGSVGTFGKDALETMFQKI